MPDACKPRARRVQDACQTRARRVQDTCKTRELNRRVFSQHSFASYFPYRSTSANQFLKKKSTRLPITIITADFTFEPYDIGKNYLAPKGMYGIYMLIRRLVRVKHQLRFSQFLLKEISRIPGGRISTMTSNALKR